MTNITLQEKIALEEVFRCFQAEPKWYIKKSIRYRFFKIFAKNKRFFCSKCKLIYRRN